ncbi:hypothetical protein ACFYQ5_12060 [Streptomyces sp. NPDC005794]|uniref:hypothetical protein n=1 Tax=Streptomyces sp. NPDC005794 TaxID=3364733 RepID=UPI00369C81BB
MRGAGRRTGQVDETAVHPSALTAAQVTAHHAPAGTPPGPGGSTVTLTPDEDAYIDSVAANTAYDDRQLASRGTTACLSHLRFTPPSAPSALGTITGAAPVSTGHSAELEASALGGALGSTTSLASTSSGTDRLRIWSSEATAAHRPQLVLTFGDE